MRPPGNPSLRNHVVDPMSLVASPSRGIDSYNAHLDLTNLDFQPKYFAWLTQRISLHHHTFQNRLSITLNRVQSNRSPNPELQEKSVEALVREIRKLREGIRASGRSDLFALQVYEVSAELALEANDFNQLFTLLPHLIFTLYPQNPTHHQIETFCFVYLLLPFILNNNISINEFLSNFIKIETTLLLKNKETKKLELVKVIYKSFIHKTKWNNFHQKITIPLQNKKTQQFNYDDIILFHIIQTYRKNIIWNNLMKSYNQINDDLFLIKCLGFSDCGNELDLWLSSVGAIRNGLDGPVLLKKSSLK